MKNLLKIVLCSSVMMAGTTLTANASTITSIQSTENSAVIVKRSGNFEKAIANMNLETGDAVYALNGASTNVRLSSTCEVSLKENQVLTVSSTDIQDCASMYSLENFNAEHLTELQASNLEGGNGILIAILASAALIGGFVIAADGSEDPPASP